MWEKPSANIYIYQGRTSIFGKESAAGRALRKKRAAAQAAQPAPAAIDRSEAASEKNSQEPEVVSESLPQGGN